MLLFTSGFFFVLNLFSDPGTDNSNGKIPGYDLTKPASVVVLPEILHEISGLTDLDSGIIACIQDEMGILFFYDMHGNRIKNQRRFYHDADYEGITRVGKTMYILRSDGVLIEIADYTAKELSVKTFDTGIPASNNEGLCYDPINKRLLIACKTKAGKGKELKDKRSVYGFDLARKKLSAEPVYSFDVGNIRQAAREKSLALPVKSKKNGEVTEPFIKFFTSAIAVHPVTRKLYVLSAADHMLFIFDAAGKLEHIEMLNSAVFNKAEGITFLQNGDMLISNEGQLSRPTLLRFSYLSR